MKPLLKKYENEEGFSLVELVVSIGLLMILTVATGIVGYGKVVENQRAETTELAVDAVYAKALQNVNGFDPRDTEKTAIADWKNTTDAENLTMSAGREVRENGVGWCMWVKAVNEDGYEYERATTEGCSDDNYVPEEYVEPPTEETAALEETPEEPQKPIEPPHEPIGSGLYGYVQIDYVPAGDWNFVQKVFVSGEEVCSDDTYEFEDGIEIDTVLVQISCGTSTKVFRDANVEDVRVELTIDGETYSRTLSPSDMGPESMMGTRMNLKNYVSFSVFEKVEK